MIRDTEPGTPMDPCVPPSATIVLSHRSHLDVDGHVPIADLRLELARQGIGAARERRWGSARETSSAFVTLETGPPGEAVVVEHSASGGPPAILSTRVEAAGMTTGDADLRVLDGLGIAFGGTLHDETGRTARERAYSRRGPVVDLGEHAVKDGIVRLSWRASPQGGALTAADGDGENVGQVVFGTTDEGALCGQDLYVTPGRRRKGIATALYDAAERLGHRVVPSDELDEDGHLFWADRLSPKAAPTP